MAEKQMGINDDEWSKKIAEGLEGVNAIMEHDKKALDKMVGIPSDLMEPEKLPGAEPGNTVSAIQGQAPALIENRAPSILKPRVESEVSSLMDTNKFEHMQRVATMFSKSKILPQIYQNDVPSCFIAIHMAERMEIDPFTFMQNSYVVAGKPALEGKLMIAVLNARGGYVDGIEYEYSGEGDDYGCRAFGTLRNGKVHEARVDIKLAKAEGWYAKNPKWKNMPDQMLAYRSAAFLLRKYRPELIMGLQTYEEVQDVDGVIVQSPVGGSYRRSDLNDTLGQG